MPAVLTTTGTRHAVCQAAPRQAAGATPLRQPPPKRLRTGSGRSWRCRASLEQEFLGLTGLTQQPAGGRADEQAGGGGGGGDDDTIAAIVTGAQQGAVAIVRLSGLDAVPIAQAVFRPAGGARRAVQAAAAEQGQDEQQQQQQEPGQQSRPAWEPESHRIYYGTVVDARGGTLDEVLLLPMLEPRSYTAEDVVEIHTHGGGISAQRVLQRCLEAGARLAAPGEFTLRAFLNGRLDLSQAEFVAQLVDARTVAAADSALAGLAGGLGREVAQMRAECVDLLVELDARLDFDDDLPPLDVPSLVARIAALAAQLDRTLATARQGQLLRAGLQVALVGRPNVGKSSLLNALSGTERAIVTDIAGTTRDIVEAGIVIGGVPITLLDTAGLRESADLVEQIGVERSVAAARAADIVVMVVDAEAGWTPGDAAICAQVFGDAGGDAGLASDWGSDGEGQAAPKRGAAPALLVLNKTDLAAAAAVSAAVVQQQNGSSSSSSSHGDKAAAAAAAAAAAGVPAGVAAQFAAVVPTSAATLAGMEELRDAVLRLAGAPQLAPGGVSWAVNERQAEALIRAGEALARAQASVAEELPLDFWTIDLRAAALALGEVSGEEVTEEVLSAIFSRFCIGK